MEWERGEYAFFSPLKYWLQAPHRRLKLQFGRREGRNALKLQLPKVTFKVPPQLRIHFILRPPLPVLPPPSSSLRPVHHRACSTISGRIFFGLKMKMIAEEADQFLIFPSIFLSRKEKPKATEEEW